MAESATTLVVNLPGDKTLSACVDYDAGIRIITVDDLKPPRGEAAQPGKRIVGILNGRPEEKQERAVRIAGLAGAACTFTDQSGAHRGVILHAASDERSFTIDVVFGEPQA